MSRFDVRNLSLEGLKLLERQQLTDSRGSMSRLFCSAELISAGWHKPIAQVNHTFTAERGSVRGMHFQMPPNAEMKLVSCISGEVWDVAVDIRSESPTFLQWHAEVLSASNKRAMLIPEGFAHGYQTLSKDVTLLYCHSSLHSPEAERALNAKDPRLQINWPLAITEISAKDSIHPMITMKFEGMRL